MPTARDTLARLHDLPFAGLDTITGDENLMILAPFPGDESLGCGGLIARSCRRGRPPFVMVLADGTASHPRSAAYPPDRLAALHERETRAAVELLGLPAERLLMVGLFDGAVPEDGPVFEAVVRAVTLVMWARDCNVVCAPWRHSPAAEHRAAFRIAAAVAARSGVGLLCYAGRSWLLPPEAPVPEGDFAGWRLDIGPALPAKREAVAAHACLHGSVVRDDPAPRLLDAALLAASLRPYEVFLRADARLPG